MSIKKPSLRGAINAHCKSCVYDDLAAGTWRTQITLCAVTICSLYPVRPTTNSLIPESVLDYYQVTGPERALYRSPSAAKAGFKVGNPIEGCPSEGKT